MAKKQVVDVKSPEYKPVLRHKQNFETLRRAFANPGSIALVEVEVDVDTLFTKGDRVARVVAVERHPEEVGEYHFIPFALMMNGNPYELLKMIEPEGER